MSVTEKWLPRWVVGLGLVVLLAGPALAYLPKDHVLLVEKGTHQLLRQPSEIERVAVGDPSVADVNVITVSYTHLTLPTKA